MRRTATDLLAQADAILAHGLATHGPNNHAPAGPTTTPEAVWHIARLTHVERPPLRVRPTEIGAAKFYRALVQSYEGSPL